MLEQIIKLDYYTFQYINQVWVNSVGDLVFPFLREPLLWVPLYVFLFSLVLLSQDIKTKQQYIWLLHWGILIFLCDGISSHIIKNLIWRPRPCIDPIWENKLRLLVNYCSNRSSFTSSHASNHFGMAIFFVLTLRKHLGHWVYLFLLWAGLISYAQVYVGLHYPLDIIAGALLGCIIASFIYFSYANLNNLTN